jgi:15-cis-phytoene synthase
VSRNPTATVGYLDGYNRLAQRSSAMVIREYSTSFGMATRLLAREIRPDIKNIYGLVRIADEIVDGAAAEAGLNRRSQCAVLDALEAETETTLSTGYSANLIVHAFAATARNVGIGPALTRPFFNSMRRDLDPERLSIDEVRDYVYGSAEVIGLMCLQVFLRGEPCDSDTRTRLENGARRLGAAFQKINFLRDLGPDWQELGRNYFPGVDPDQLTETQKQSLVADIRADLDAAAAVIPDLPRICRGAVAAVHGLFTELVVRIRAIPAAELQQQRMRVPNTLKLRIVLEAKTGSLARRAL